MKGKSHMMRSIFKPSFLIGVLAGILACSSGFVAWILGFLPAGLRSAFASFFGALASPFLAVWHALSSLFQSLWNLGSARSSLIGESGETIAAMSNLQWLLVALVLTAIFGILVWLLVRVVWPLFSVVFKRLLALFFGRRSARKTDAKGVENSAPENKKAQMATA